MTRGMSVKEQSRPEGGSPQNETVHSISPGPRGSKISIKIPSEHAYQQTETQTDEFLMGPRPGSVGEDEIIRMTATRVIERAWLSYRDRQMFKLLKHAVCAAEHCLSFEILRKVSPMEANLLKDPSFQVRVRFRFAGSDFPPEIVFKVFIHTGGQGVNYVSGKRVIKPATNAAADSCRLMGHRKFYDQMIRDACQHEKDRVTDEIDIITMKDYMQYLSNMDETPAYMGGKENLWRKLSLEGSKIQYLSNMDETPAYMGGKENLWRKLSLEGEMGLPSNTGNMDETPAYMGGKENLWRKLSLEAYMGGKENLWRKLSLEGERRLPSNSRLPGNTKFNNYSTSATWTRLPPTWGARRTCGGNCHWKVRSGCLATVGCLATLGSNMQYLSNMDETPAYMGGKENLWRKLSLEALPRQSIMYDIVEYLYHTGTPSSRLQADLPILMSRPITQEIQLQHIQAISQLRTPPPAPCTTAQSRTRPRPLSSGGRSQRGSKQAKKRAQQMRKLYQQEGKEVGNVSSPRQHPPEGHGEGGVPGGRGEYLGVPGEDQEDWEQEADKLYEWTQELNFDDLAATPRYEL
ncbi:CXorf58 [Branchiostoma lanceolatum]|uniref:CXorf58 protein n=1 Tax=Branchiostoma lanceolatum TaxID=7740 RepID=A0A8J9Z230_BRALA|nr:CXorf58 [Branchiostoma lanceolatum]